jgi:hypothetical protein
MKTLLLATLTTALISFNSFADSTTDIQNMANTMVKENILQMNKQFTIRLTNEIKNSLNRTSLYFDNTSAVLLVKTNEKSNRPTKHTATAAE